MKWIAMLVSAVLLLAACGDEPQYHEGQMVKSKLSGQKGMVVFVDCAAQCRYWVRFASVSFTTDTHVLAPDGAVQIEPFSTVTMREYELESAQ